MSDQPDRRRISDTDHDTLTRIDANLLNFIEDFKNHKVLFAQHVKDDSEQFDRFNKFMWTIFGGFSVLELALRLWDMTRK